MVLIGEIFIRHVAGIAAIGHFADGVHAIKRYARTARVGADVVARNQALASDDEFLGGAGEIEVGNRGAADSAVPIAVGFMNVNSGHGGIKSWQSRQSLPGEGTSNPPGAAAKERVRAQHGPAGKKGNTHTGRLEAD